MIEKKYSSIEEYGRCRAQIIRDEFLEKLVALDLVPEQCGLIRLAPPIDIGLVIDTNTTFAHRGEATTAA